MGGLVDRIEQRLLPEDRVPVVGEQAGESLGRQFLSAQGAGGVGEGEEPPVFERSAGVRRRFRASTAPAGSSQAWA
jgi:hypothetical protein